MVGKKAEGRIWRQIWLEKLACAFQAVIHVPDSVICLWKNLSDTERLKADLDLHREGSGVPLQHSCLQNPMDGGAWWAAVHGVTKSWTRLSDFTFTFYFHALEEEMATTPVFLPGESQGQRSLVAAVYGVSQSRTRLERLSSSSTVLLWFCMLFFLLWKDSHLEYKERSK